MLFQETGIKHEDNDNHRVWEADKTISKKPKVGQPKYKPKHDNKPKHDLQKPRLITVHQHK